VTDQQPQRSAGSGQEGTQRWQGFVPWDELRLEHVEAQARFCETGCACSQDVLSLVDEVRRLKARLDGAGQGDGE
jgi:hypothetical protein